MSIGVTGVYLDKVPEAADPDCISVLLVCYKESLLGVILLI